MGLFGTDGIRGIANEELTPELAFHVGKAGGVFFRRQESAVASPVILGRDTRRSGQMLSAAVAAGFMSAGCSVRDLGVAPTPAVAFITSKLECAGGVVISASHNPWQYNGIKFFSATGAKLLAVEEEELENVVERSQCGLLEADEADPSLVGSLEESSGLLGVYRQALVSIVQDELGEEQPLRGLVVAVDCAHGAAAVTAPEVFERLGARVVTIGTHPDGMNINAGVGSLHPEVVAARVVNEQARFGFAFDGDADRVIAVAEEGTIVDGDRIMAVCARDLKEQDRLPGDTLVATVMSNMALDLLLGKAGITVVRTPVGDREVYARMKRLGAVLGGEQSGHIIFAEHNQTGDGLLTALKLVATVRRQRSALGIVVADFEPLPQKLVNVAVEDKQRAVAVPEVKQVIGEVQDILDGRGRVLVRPSGTEPVVRVMVEGPDEDELSRLAQKIASAVRRHAGT